MSDIDEESISSICNNVPTSRKRKLDISIPNFTQSKKSQLINKIVPDAEKEDIVYVEEVSTKFKFNGVTWIALCINKNCNTRSDQNLYDNIKTRYCILCAKIHDKKWTKARHDALLCRFENCEAHRYSNEDFCLRHFKVQNPDKYDIYHNKRECITNNCKRNKVTQKYGFFRCSQYCHFHAKIYDLEWYANYYEKRKCATCDFFIANKNIEGISTIYCRLCAQLYDPEWYKSWHSMYGCKSCTSTRSSCVLKFEGSNVFTEYCISCSESHNIKWYELYCEKYGCMEVGCKLKKKHFTYENLTTEYCFTHSQINNILWFEAYERSKKCRIEHCNNTNKSNQNDPTPFCVTHSKLHDPDWHRRYTYPSSCKICKNGTRVWKKHCIKCLKSEKPKEFILFEKEKKCLTENCFNKKKLLWYGLNREPLYCTKCSITKDLEWYSAYKKLCKCLTETCENLKFGESAGNNYSTPYCIKCSKIYDLLWYENYRNFCKCKLCPNQKSSNNRGNRKTVFCILCAKLHDFEWYQKYHASQMCSTKECVKFKTSELFDGKRSQHCISCSKQHDPIWYKFYKLKYQCNKLGCKKFRRDQNGTCKKHTPGYIETVQGTSKVACQFIDSYENEMNIKVQHIHISEDGKVDGVEHKIIGIGKKGTKIDGWIESTQTVIEFHGSYWHGDPNVYDYDDIHPIIKLPYGELYDRTMLRMQILKNLGFNVIYVWEQDFYNWLKQTNHPLLNTIIKSA